MPLLKRETASGVSTIIFSPSGVYKQKGAPYSSRPQCLADVVTRKRPSIIVSRAQVAELVDALDLGSSAARCKSSSLFSPTTQISIS